MVSICCSPPDRTPAWVVLALAEVGEQAEHVVEGPAPELAGALQTKLEILLHRQAGEDLAILRNVAQPGMGDLVGTAARRLAAP